MEAVCGMVRIFSGLAQLPVAKSLSSLLTFLSAKWVTGISDSTAAFLQESEMIKRKCDCHSLSYGCMNVSAFLMLKFIYIITNARTLIGQSAMVYCAGKPI